MKKIFIYIVFVGCIGAFWGCDSDGACVQGETYATGQTKSALTQFGFIEEEPGKLAFETLKKHFESKRSFRLGVYQIEHPSAYKMIETKGLRMAWTTEKSLFAEDDTWEYQFDRHTSFESAGSKEEMHSLPGVPEYEALEDLAYLKRAWEYLESYRNEYSQYKHLSLQPYKIRKYYTSGTNMRDKLSQVAVSVTSSVDGWPVLGPAKTAVHFSPSGDVIGYTKDHRFVQNRVFELTERDILTPEEAVKMVMDDNDIPNLPYRMEFGYFDGGRHSAKELLAPYYMFVFESESGSKDLVRWIPAIKNNRFLDAVQIDDARDIKRKQSLVDDEAGDKKYE